MDKTAQRDQISFTYESNNQCLPHRDACTFVPYI